MLTPLTLSVPLGKDYRALAADAAAKYAELAGCAASSSAKTAAAVLADLAARAEAIGGVSHVTLECRAHADQVDIVIQGSGRPVTLHCALP